METKGNRSEIGVMNELNIFRNIEEHGELTIMEMHGVVTYANLNEVQMEYAAISKERNIKNVVFDVGGVDKADSTSVAAIIDLMKQMKIKNSGGQVGLMGLSGEMKSLIHISKVEAIITEYHSRTDAIEALG